MFTGGSVFVELIRTDVEAYECAALQGEGLEGEGTVGK